MKRYFEKGTHVDGTYIHGICLGPRPNEESDDSENKGGSTDPDEAQTGKELNKLRRV